MLMSRPCPRRLAVALAGLSVFAATTTGTSASAEVLPAAAAAAGPSYTLTDLGVLGDGTASLALGVSANGIVAGTSRTGAGSRPQVAVRWRDGQIENLGTLPGSTFSRAFASNARGQSIGEAFTPAPGEVSRAVLWEPDGTLRDLGTLGGRSAVANDIDERGRAFGVSSQSMGPSLATVWDSAGPQALPALDPQATGSSRVNAVSRPGVAVGSAPARIEGGTSVGQAVRWNPHGRGFEATALDRLEPGRFAVALGVSENGLTAGEATRLDPGTTRTSTRAVLWQGTAVAELPGLGTYRFTRASDVTDNGDTVGFASGFAGFPSIDGAAVLWRDGQAIDLNTAVVGGTGGWVLRSAESTNERGQIVGFGTRNGQNRAFLLTPTSRG